MSTQGNEKDLKLTAEEQKLWNEKYSTFVTNVDDAQVARAIEESLGRPGAEPEAPVAKTTATVEESALTRTAIMDLLGTHGLASSVPDGMSNADIIKIFGDMGIDFTGIAPGSI